ncbi:MAG: hypothetical protein CVV18_02220 [Gammaproteobacteria bacterium HGW-Gammaproteobacteria-8]|nr:MAG: hypothetical protein CVV18_02220 [Gammaproteobacteria bacterium HGW-Gammaproteobacteria-8]
MNLSDPSPSLLLRLSISAVVVVILALGLIGLVVNRAYLAAERVALDERLENTVFAVLAGLEVSDDGGLDWAGAPAESLLTQAQSGLYAGVYGGVDEWLSPSTLGLSIPLDQPAVARGEAMRQAADAQSPWHVYRLGLGWELPDGRIVDLVVWAAEAPERLQQSVRGFRANLWRWLALAAVVLLAAQVLLLFQPLHVLRRIAAEIREIEAGKREQLGGGYPRELTPLTENLNALLATERSNVEQYSQALGDLAHSLKTPLAVLNARAESGEPIPADEMLESVRQMQLRIRDELERAARTARRTLLPPLALRPHAEKMLRSLGKLYGEVDFTLACDPALQANIAERDLIEILGNLLENAAKYGDGKVRLALSVPPRSGRRSGVIIEVADNGPGLASGQFEKLLQRGVRGDQRAEGQGLGLAIVQRIVDSYHGQIRAERSEWGGLKLLVELRPG